MPITPEMLETRTIAKEKFSFLVVDSPEKWVPASEIKHEFRMVIPGSDTVLNIPMQGLSYEQYGDIIGKHIWPEWNEQTDPPPEVVAARERTANLRRMEILETALGHKIPGTTYEDKKAFLDKSNPGNLEAMDRFIRGELNNTETYQGVVLANFNAMRQRFPQENVVQISSFADLIEKSACVIHAFRTNRLGQDYITEFPLKSLSQEQKEEIEKRTPEPQPPMIPAFHPVTRQIIPGKTKVNYEDPTYIRTMNKSMKFRTLLYLNACLPFRIPGETEDEQTKWIGDRLVGDVRQINIYINEVILGMEGRYNFFMIG